MKQYRIDIVYVVTFLLVILYCCISVQQAIAYEKEIKDLSSTLSESIVKAEKRNIAVVDFTDLEGNVTKLGRFIAEEFSVALLNTAQGFEVVDRTHLKTLIQEHKLSTTGLIDPATARKLGQIAGVEALITGTITPFGETVRLSVKILDTNTAKLIGATAGEIPKTKAIEELLVQEINFKGNVGNSSGSQQAPRNISGKQIQITGKSLTTGQKNKQYNYIRFSLVSLLILQDGRIQFNTTWENINQDRLPMEVKLEKPQSNMYLVDDIGNEYAYLESEGITEQNTLVRPGTRKSASFIFSKIKSGANSLTLYMDFWAQREGKGYYTDRFIVDGLKLIKF